MVLQTRESPVQSLSHSICTLTQSAWDQIRQTRSQALTPAPYPLLKSKINGDYLVQGSPQGRKQGISTNQK